MREIRVLPIGSYVHLGRDVLMRGQVLAICIRESGVTYEVVWWDKASRSTAWLSESEVSPTDDTVAMTIGVYL